MAVSIVAAQGQCAAIQTLITAGPPEECDGLAVGWLCIITPGTLVNGYDGAFTFNDQDQDLGYTLPVAQTTWVEGKAAAPDSDAWGMIFAKLPLVETEPGSIYRPPFANMILSGEFTLNTIVMVEPQLLTSFTLETGTSDSACSDGLLDGLLLTMPQDAEVDLQLAINGIDLVIPPNGALYLTAPPDAATTIRSLSGDVTVNGVPLAAGMMTTVEGGTVATPAEVDNPFDFVALEALQPLRAVEPVGFAELALTVTPDTFGIGPVFDLLEAENVTALSIANDDTGAVFAVTRIPGSDWVLADSATVDVDVSGAQDALN